MKNVVRAFEGGKITFRIFILSLVQLRGFNSESRGRTPAELPYTFTFDRKSCRFNGEKLHELNEGERNIKKRGGRGEEIL